MNRVTAAAHARLGEWITTHLASALPAWLPAQRWFGGKSRTIAAATLEEIAWLDTAETPAAVVIIRVDYAGAPDDPERYAIVVGLTDQPDPSTSPVPIASGIDGGRAAVVDCGAAAPAVHALLLMLAEGRECTGERGGVIVGADQATSLREFAHPSGLPAIRPLGHEQSNTSVRVGSRHVFKLMRRLQHGEHPQLEIGRFLQRTSFRAAPPLEGSLWFRAADGREFAIGVLEGWIDNQGDGWQHVVRQLESVAHGDGSADVLSDDFSRLGTTTADFHLAMASDAGEPGFAPEPVTPARLASWRSQVLEQAGRAVALVERVLRGWPEPLRSQGQALLDARANIRQRLDTFDPLAQDTDFHVIRIHGDFHLGQTLKTADGFTLIDFEGEPLKSITERRLKHCALKDVAGMLRSIEYAAADVRARVRDAADAVLSTTPLRRAFSESYVAQSCRGGAPYLPGSRAAIDGLCSLFELEKALYELEYEINNRPGWIHIPLRTVNRQLGAGT